MDFQLGDVSRLDFLRDPFELVRDIGCLHGLDRASRTGYAEQLRRLTRPGGEFLLFGFARPVFLGRSSMTGKTRSGTLSLGTENAGGD